MTDALFRCIVQEEPDRTWIVLSGELDMASQTHIAETAHGAARRGVDVQVDLSGVSFLDGTGLSSLMSLAQVVADAGATVRFVRQPAVVGRLLDLTATTLSAPSSV